MRSKIREQAIHLSKLVIASEEYQNLKKAQKLVQDDPQAMAIMLDYQTLGMEANQKIMRGSALSPEEIRGLNEKEMLIKGNKKLQEWSNFQIIFSKMMEDMLKLIQQGLTGDDNIASTAGRMNIYEQ